MAEKIKYISDLIKPQIIRSWDDDDIILINGPTGCGKTHFIINDLQPHARAYGKRILLLSNRVALKNQNERELKDIDDSVITPMNYQQIENAVMYQDGGNIGHYDYIVADESHYFFNDSIFNRKTDLALDWLLEQKNSTRLLLSATSGLVEEFFDSEYIPYIPYRIKPDYSYINGFYFYKSNDAVRRMLSELPPDEKAIYFGPIEEAYNISRELDDAAFVCSKHNKSKARHSDVNELINITENERFNAQVLCSTTVLDNGVNIKDEQVKHVLVDVFDLDTIQQCVGRVRIQEGQTIKVYIRNRNRQSLNGTMFQLINDIRPANILLSQGEAEYVKLFGKTVNSPMVDFWRVNDTTQARVNRVMHWKAKFLLDACKTMMDSENGFIKAVARRFRKDVGEIVILDDLFASMTLNDKIAKLVGKKLYREEQAALKESITNDLFNSRKMKQGTLSMTSINDLIEDCGLDYHVTSKRERARNGKRDQTYWMIAACE
ncbi:MAG: DEAD/DEAH box helicase family protein [Solirubrobacterales bacterium]